MVLLDSVKIKSESLKFQQFARTNKFGLVKEGNVSKAILLDLNSLEIKLNCPWTKAIVLKYYIRISQNEEVLYSGYLRNNSIVSSEIQTAINKLKRGGIIKFSNIHARLPWDDGLQPQDMTFICN